MLHLRRRLTCASRMTSQRRQRWRWRRWKSLAIDGNRKDQRARSQRARCSQNTAILRRWKAAKLHWWTRERWVKLIMTFSHFKYKFSLIYATVRHHRNRQSFLQTRPPSPSTSSSRRHQIQRLHHTSANLSRQSAEPRRHPSLSMEPQKATKVQGTQRKAESRESKSTVLGSFTDSCISAAEKRVSLQITNS